MQQLRISKPTLTVMLVYIVLQMVWRRPGSIRWLWSLWVALLGVIYSAIPNHSDQFDADYIADRMLHGARLYVDIVDMNWPGEPLIHMLACWIPYGVFYAWRVVDFGVMLVATLCLASIFAGEWDALTGHIVKFFFPMFYLSLGSVMPGQRDMLIANMLFVVAWFHLRAWRDNRLMLQVPVGLLIGVATLIKPTAAPVGLLLVLHSWLACAQPHKLRSIALNALVAGSVAITTVAVGFLTIHLLGTPWLAIWNCCVVYNSATQYLHGASGGDMAKNFVTYLFDATKLLIPFIAIGTVRLFTGLRHGIATRCLVPLLLLMGFGNFWLQGRGFTWHLSIFWTTLMAVACLGIAQVFCWAKEKKFRLLGVAGLLLLGALSIRKLHNQLPILRVIAGQKTTFDLMTNRIDIAGTADVLGLARTWAPADHNVLYVTFVPSAAMQLSRWVSPTRFYYPFMLTNANALLPFGEQWLHDFEQDVTTRPPAMCILDTETYAELQRTNPRVVLILDRLLSNYAEKGRVDYVNKYISTSPPQAIVYVPRDSASARLSESLL